MRTVKYTSAALLWITLSITAAMGQDNSALVKEYRNTKKSADSVQNAISDYRDLLGTDKTKDEGYTSKIISLENTLYTLKAKLEQLGGELLSNDPDALQKIAKELEATAEVKQYLNLVDDPFVRKNLSPTDISLISSAKIVEPKIEVVGKEIETHYEQLTRAKSLYMKTYIPKELDSLTSLTKELKELINGNDSSIEHAWKSIYDKKLDAYLMLIDKMENVDRIQIEEMENARRSFRRAEALSVSSQAPKLTLYWSQRELLLRYEMLIATKLGQKLASDSLKKELNTLTRVNLPTIGLKPRSLVVYSKPFSDGVYTSQDPDSIPPLVVPQKGIYYSVQVAVLQNKPASLEIFRGVRPLRVRKLSNGMSQYLSGGFKTYNEALAAVMQLQKVGFRNPVAMVAWVDGAVTTTAKAKVAEDIITKANVGKFRIEVLTQNSELATSLRQIVDDVSTGKQITRSGRGDDMLFTITQFNNQLEAESLAEIIEANEDTKVEIIKIN